MIRCLVRGSVRAITIGKNSFDLPKVWSGPCKFRFFVDHQGLNDLTRKDAYPLLRIDDALDSLHKAGFQPLTLSLGIGRLNLPLKTGIRQRFVNRQELFEFNL